MRIVIRQPDPTTSPTIELDGHDVASSVASLHLQMDPRDLPQLYLQLRSNVEDLSVDGVVYVTPEAPKSAADELCRLLAHLDAEAIQAQALESMGWGESTPGATARAIMDAIAATVRSAYE